MAPLNDAFTDPLTPCAALPETFSSRPRRFLILTMRRLGLRNDWTGGCCGGEAAFAVTTTEGETT